MQTLLNSVRFLSRHSESAHMPRSIRRRRHARGERSSTPTLESLEVRTLLSAATHLAFAIHPTNTVAGNGVASMTVNVEDADNAVDTTYNSLVVVSIETGPAGTPGTLYYAVPAVNGVATLEGLAFTTAGSYTLRVTSGSLAAGLSNSFDITADAAAQLVITQQSASDTAGDTLSSLVVSVQDQFGNVVTTNTSNVTVALASGTGVLNGTKTVAAVAGVATFSTLSINESGTYTLSASGAGLTGAVSDSLTISPAAAAKLTLTQQPANIIAGQNLSTITVAVQDTYGNVVTTDTSNVTIALTGGGMTLTGTKTVAASNGIATFSGLSMTQAGSYTLDVTDGALTADTSDAFTVNAAAATHLVFTQQPVSGTVGALGTIDVSIEDQYGNVVTTNTSNVTVALASGSGTLLGTKTVAAVAGVATFNALSIHQAGGYTLSATHGSLTAVTSDAFTMSADAADRLTITQQTTNSIAGDTLSSIIVAVQDQYGNVITNNSSTVTIAVATGDGALGGTTSVSAVNGVATFANLSITTADDYTLVISDGALTTATTTSFTVAPDVATQLVFTQQPAGIAAGALGAIVVSVKDEYGNVVTSDASTVTLSVASGPGGLLGTVAVAAVNGVATFNALAIHAAGAYTLHAANGEQTAANSNAFTITPTTANHLAFTSQPTSIVAGNLLTGVTVSVEDQYNNVVTTSNANITFTVTIGTTNSNFVVAANNGVATLNSIYLVRTGTCSIRAASSGLTQAFANTITITPDVASKLVITQQPVSDTAGHTLANIIAEVRDQFDNIVTTDTSNVTIAIASGAGTLLGTQTLAAVAGVATFSTLSIQQADTFTLSLTDGSLTAATSNAFTISPDAAHHLTITQQPASDTAGQTLANILVQVRDQYNNLVTTDTSNVTIAIASGSGTLLGTTTVAAASGVATFSTLAIQQADTFTLSVTDGSLTAATSNAFTISPDAAHHLTITQQPVSGAAGALSTLQVAVRDQYNNLVTTDTSNVTIAIASGTGTLLGTTTVAAASGVATFSALAIHDVDTFTLSVTDGSLTAATSSSFTISPDAAHHLTITQQPASDTAGHTLANILVQVRDQYNNLVTTDTSNVTIAIASGSGTLLGTTTVAAASGVATFSTLAIQQADTFTLSVTDGSLTAATSNAFTISPDAAHHLTITQQPVSGAAGALSTLQVAVRDQYNNLVTTDTSNVTIAIASGTGTLLGTTTVAAASGVATFSALAIHDVDTFTLSVTDGSLTAATSNAFTISPDAAHHLTITQQPASDTAGHTLANILVQVRDQYNNLVTTDTSNVTIAIASGTGTLLGTTTVAAASGVATFSTLAIQQADTFTLSVTDGSLTAATSNAFTISPDAAHHLTITQQPASDTAGHTLASILVQVRDQYNNLVTTDTSNVTIAIASGTGTLLGTTTVAAASGVATFSTLAIQQADTFTLSVTDGSLTAATSNAFTISPDAAHHLTITQQPVSGAAGALSTLQVAVRDQYNNLVTTDTSNVTIAIASGTGTLLGTTTVAAASGVATFSALAIHDVDTFTLSVTDGSLTAATSSSFTISPDAAHHLTITQQPASDTAGHTLANILVQVRDQYNNLVTTDTSNVTIAIASGSGTLLGTTTVAAASGVATFSTLSIQQADTFTLSVTDGSLTAATSNAFTISPDAAHHLTITQQPASDTAGHTLANILVQVRDQYNNLVTTDSSNVTIAIATGTGTLLGTTTVAAASGVATFSTLSIQQADTFTLSVTDGSLTAATSSSFTISPDAAHHLTITQQPVSGVAGALSTLQVAVRDQYNNLVTTDTSNVTIAIASGTGTLLGTTTVAAASGVATFSALAIHDVDTFTLSVTDGSLTAATSNAFTISPDAAHHLTITQQPASDTAGHTLASILVQVRDQYNNLVTTDTSNVTLAIASGTGTLLGTQTLAAVAGVATFSTLAIQQADTFTLSVTDGSLTAATSNAFTISPDAAHHLTITQQPVSGAAGALSTLQVAVRDQYNNLVTTDTSNVTIAIASGTGTLLGTTTVAAASGVATFSALAIHDVDTFTLSVTDGSLTAATSNAFTISPDAAHHLTITQQPVSDTAGHTLASILVQVRDQYNNLVTTDTSNVTIAIASGTGTLLGTPTVAAVGGVATFSTLAIQQADTFTLSVTDGSLTAATSNAFTISPDAAHHLTITQQPASDTAGQTLANILVQVRDQYNNLVTTDTSNVTIAIASGSGTLLGTTTVAAASGVATFSTLAIQQADTFTLSVTDGSLTAATSNAFTISPDAAHHLTITQQPVSGAAGALSTLQVAVRDQYNNLVTTDTSNVTIAIASGTGTLLGTTTVAAASGVATFSALAIHDVDTFTLSVTDGSLTAATSSSFTISPDAAHHLTITQQPASDTAGHTLANILVQVRDQYNNLVTTDTSNVTIAIASGSGTLLGTTTVAAASGVATFSTLAIQQADTFTLSVTDGSLTAATSNAFTISPDAAHHLTITQQPVSGAAGALSTLQVAVRDQYNNLVTTDTSNVTIAIASGTGTLLGTTTVAAASGVATFSALAIHDVDTFTLSVTDGSLTAATSNAFTISPDAAHHLTITQQPASDTAGHTLANILVQVRDQYNNLVTTDTSNVTIAIASGTGTLLGTTTVAAASGVATFSTLAIQQADTFTLSVTDGSLTAATSNAFTISPDAAHHLTITQQPASDTAGHTLASILVQVRDQYNNLVTTDTSNVTIAIASGTGTLLGTTTVAAASGVATFSTLAIQQADTFTLSVTDGSLTAATSNAFTISPDAAHHLTITQQPVSGAAGALSTLQVAVRDQYNNLVTTDTSNVTIAIASGTGTLLGTTTVAAASGVATFSALAIHDVDTFTLSVTDGSLTAATSNAFTISPAAASQLVFTQQPANAVAGELLSPVIVSVKDTFGNVVTTNNSSLTLSVTTGGSTISLMVAATNGVATFSGFSLTRTGTYAFRVTGASVPAANSTSFTISPDVASQLVFTQQPANGAAGTLNAMVAAIEDQYGNIVTTDTSEVTIALASGSGTLLGTKTVTAVAGVATFSTLGIQTPGSFTLSVTDGSLTAATSNAFTISPDAAHHLTITQQPASDTAGHTLANIVAQVRDQYNNVVTTDTSNVTIAIATGTGTLLGTQTVAAVAGVATFSTLSIQQADTFTLSLTDGSLTAATSNAFTISPDAAHHLTITQQPVSDTAGHTLASILVQVRDQYNNLVTTDTSNVTLAIASGTGTLLGTQTLAAVAGVATFSTLAIQQADTFTLSVTDGSLTAATSNAFTISPDAAHHLTITQQPVSGAAGALSTLQVAVRDQYNNLVTTDTSNVTIAIASGTGTLLGTTTVAAASGVATFSALAIHDVDTFTLSVTDGSLTAATSNAFTISPDAAHHLTITQQPASDTAGDTLAAITVAVQDQYGNVVTANTSNVTIAIASGSGTLLGTTTVSAVNGVAAFTTLSIQQAGSYTFNLTDGALSAATSNSMTISPAAATQLAILQPPANDVVGTSHVVTVAVQDQYGNQVTTDTSSITATLFSDGTPLGGPTIAAVNGVATFNTSIIDLAGTFSLVFTDGLLNPTTSSNFTLAPDVAAQLVITQQPVSDNAGHILSGIVVEVRDQYGNRVTTDNSNITVALATGNGNLLGTKSVAAVNGVASFSTLSIHETGAFTLTVTDGSLTAATSNAFTISPDAAHHLTITQQPASDTAGHTLANIVAQVRDQYNNVVTTDASNVTIAIASGNGNFLGTTTVAAVNGIATFSTLSIQQADTYTLSLTDGSLTAATSNAFTISPDAVHHLTITQQPVSDTAGHTLANILVQVRDQYNNLVTTDTSNVTIAIATGTGTLLGTTTVAAANGVATFSTLSIQQAGSFTLSLTDGSLTTATSNSFVISPDAAHHLTITQQPTSAIAGDTLASITAEIVDQYNNVITTDTSNVTIAIASGTGTLLGTTTVAAVNGIASFDTLSFHQAGDYTLTVSDGSLTSDTSSSITILPDVASQLVITQQPADETAGNTLGSIIVALRDQFDNLVTTDTSEVSISLDGSAVLNGTTTVSVSDGIAVFNDLTLTQAGTYTFQIACGSLDVVTSDSFTISPDVASQIVITQQPLSDTAGQTLAVIAEIQDQYGNLVTTDSSAVAIEVTGGSGTLGGTLSVTADHGIATFDDLALTVADDYTFGISSGDLTAAASEDFTISPADASQLVILQQPGNVATGSLTELLVAIQDQYGNLVTSDTSDVTIALAGSTVALGGTTTVAAVDGVATFSDLAVTRSGRYRLMVTDADLTLATTDYFNVGAKLVFQVQPTTTVAGETMSAVRVLITDSAGHVLTDESSSVTLDIASGSDDGELLGTLTVDAVNGVAVFSDLSIEYAAIYRLQATSDFFNATLSSSFTVNPDVAVSLELVQDATDSVAGVKLSPMIFRLRDQYGNIAVNNHSSMTLSIASGPDDAALSGTVTATVRNGLATFNYATLKMAGTYVLQAATGSLSVDTSSFEVSPNIAKRVVFAQQLGASEAGANFAPAITINVVDAYGNLVIDSSATISLTRYSGPTGGTLTPVSIDAVDGQATFPDVALTKAGAYKLKASAYGLTATVSNAFAITPADAAQFVFTLLPKNGLAGASNKAALKVTDQYGNLVTSYNSNVTLTIATGPGGAAISGTATVAAVNGIVSFNSVSYQTAGTYVVQATDGSIQSGTSSTFTITPAAARQLLFVQQPADNTASTPFTPNIAVRVADQYGNTVTSSRAAVRMNIATGPAYSTLTGIASVAAANGVATFNSLSLTTLGTYSLRATCGTLVAAISNSFIISE